MESLAALRDRRAFKCRLYPRPGAGSLDEADLFLRGRGVLTRTADCALPSLYEACHEDPYQPGRPGFATWPATKWPWFGALAERGYLGRSRPPRQEPAGIRSGARLLDPICRAEIARMRGEDRGWARLLDHLATAGPSTVEDLRAELGLKRQELNALRAPLQRRGAIVARSPMMTGDREHSHASELLRWDQAYPSAQLGGQDQRPGSRQRARRPDRSRRGGSRRAGSRTTALVLLALVLVRALVDGL